VLRVASAGEAVTGVALLISPASVGALLFGTEPVGVGLILGRLTGIALVALGIACWPSDPTRYTGLRGPALGMLVYSGAATVYLAFVAFAGEYRGTLLWPAIIVHLVLTLMLARLR
jgi:hypothetical protein